jgi:hypothetical protein
MSIAVGVRWVRLSGRPVPMPEHLQHSAASGNTYRRSFHPNTSATFLNQIIFQWDKVFKPSNKVY